jgi:molybdopterin synthase catalytic subunit
VKIAIHEKPFDPYAEITAYQQQALAPGHYGATASFVGTMRDFNDGKPVHSMMLEYYPGMTEKHIERICVQAVARWSVIDCLVIHRAGQIQINDAIVVIAVWASHRGDALDACKFIIEDLKSKAPFWKKERRDEGEAWVQGNTTGYAESKGSVSIDPSASTPGDF